MSHRSSFLFRTVVCAALLGAAGTGTAFAQALSIGVKGGLNLATLGGPNAGAFDTRTTYTIAGFATYRLSNLLALQPEVLYTHKGGDAEAVEGTGGVRLSYVEVPVLARVLLPVPGSRRIQPHLFAGPAVGFRLGCQVDAEVDEKAVRFDCDDPLFGGELATRKMDYGLVFGGDASVRLGPVALVLDGRYDLGLSSIDGTSARDDVRNRVFSLLVGISVDPGR
jgi:hypothetical protein